MGSEIWVAAVMAVGAYLIGSIPFGIVVSKALGTIDPRTAGSQNIGFTNVLRVSGATAGAFTLIGDGGKGWLVAWLATRMVDNEPAVLLIASAAVIGHLYSIFLCFSGGKGVATAIGAVTGMAPWVGVIVLGLWLLAVGATRISSMGALVAFTGLPFVAFAVGRSWEFILCILVMSVLILARHRENIGRMVTGTEPRIGRRR